MNKLISYKSTLASMSEDDILNIMFFIKNGYGARGIKLETRYTLKQINAVFALTRG